MMRPISALYFNFVSRQQARPTGQDANLLRMIEQALIFVGAIVLDNLIFLSDEFSPMHRHLHWRQARIAWMRGLIDQPGGLNQILRGQAAPISTGSPDRAILGHDNGFAEFGSMECCRKGGRATA